MKLRIYTVLIRNQTIETYILRKKEDENHDEDRKAEPYHRMG